MLIACLTFNGNTEEAFTFYQSVLGGEFTSVQRLSDTPHGAALPDDEKRKIMHISLKTPHGIIMGNDHMEFAGESYQVGNNFSMSLHPESEQEAKKLFDGLSRDGMVIMPLDKVFWGAYFGTLIDQFGLKWMVNCQEG